MKGSPEADAIGSLRRRSEHRQRVRRNGKLLEEMMIYHGIDIKAAFVGVLDLAHDFPDHFVVRLSRRRLNLAIDAKSHASSPATACVLPGSPI